MASASTAGWASWPRNVKLFLIFRVFFNARYYYPVFALLFLDLGLTLAQFAALNALWAVVIVGLEVPSGAMADLFGRRKLLRIASGLMVIEMVCLLIPRFAPALLLPAMAVNRICSGAAEALASGADEALAYDSLGESQQGQWSGILERQMRYLNAAMMVCMLVGAAVYDPKLWAHWLSSTQAAEVAILAPVVLTLIHSFVAVAATWVMEEVSPEPAESKSEAIRAAFRQTMDTVRWLLGKPAIRVVIVGAVLFDHLIRQGLVVSSDYLTSIGIGKAYLGPLGALSALAGSLSAKPLAALSTRLRPVGMFWLLYGGLMVASFGLAQATPRIGAVWIVSLSVLAGAVGFCTSLYLNQLAEAKRRATLLSVKGLAINLGYGWISLAYAGFVAAFKDGSAGPPVIGAFKAYIPYGTVLTLPVALWAWRTPQAWGGPGGYSTTSSARRITSRTGAK